MVLSSAGSQQPAVTLQKRSGKGWGVYADEPLPAGSLLGQYGGEYISNAEAQRRLKEYDTSGGGHALLVRGPAVCATLALSSFMACMP